MHIKAEGMTQFGIFHVFVEILVNSELCFFCAINQPKTEIYPKMPMFEQLKKTSSSKLKIFFELEIFWDEVFRIIKAHGPKNQPHIARGVIGSPPPPTMYFQKMQF